MIIEVNNVLVHTDIITECFCCDLEACKGKCCIEGDAGAPVLFDEIAEIEESCELVWDSLSASAQAVIDKQGVVYTDREGDLVTSIVNGKDCVFTCYKDLEIDGENIEHCCLCAYDKAYREGKITWAKPISCALYPIRESKLSNGLTGIVYHRWHVCKDAVKKGNELGLPLYQFLKEPLIRRFGEAWYQALCEAAVELKNYNG